MVERKTPEAPFKEGQEVWQRTCTLDMGLPRVMHVIAEMVYEKGEWWIRFDKNSPEKYPPCYFEPTEPEPLVATNPGRKVPRY